MYSRKPVRVGDCTTPPPTVRQWSLAPYIEVKYIGAAVPSISLLLLLALPLSPSSPPPLYSQSAVLTSTYRTHEEAEAAAIAADAAVADASEGGAASALATSAVHGFQPCESKISG
jgi:hypothetical protein